MNNAGFKLLHREHVEALKVTVESHLHEETRARHLHLATDDGHNAFLVAFLTIPTDSTGVAHILEHTTLCGSQRYPVRDPFFMMLRRSLSTFMNAFTASDWTAYPFASQSRKDFGNLLDVYLDATFFPQLLELDFAQEGCRIELENPEDPASRLVYKGVVFNEMKGAMSSPERVLWEHLSRHIFPTNAYHFNSGGDPEHIPELTWEALKKFHARHYHPSNAIFMTFGDIPAAEHQKVFAERVLSRFTGQAMDLGVGREQRRDEPLRVTGTYALDGEEETSERTHVVVGWLLGESVDQELLLKTHLLNGVLLDNSSSPLLKFLETTDLGTAPSPICGLDDSGREMVFACGVEGSEPEHADAVEQGILEVIERVAREGVEQERVAAVLHQLELSRREIGGDGLPYGLKLMLTALPAALHGGDPVSGLALDPILERLREEITHPEFIKDLARKWILDNPHRVRVVLTPDTTLNARLAQKEADRLAQLKEKMTVEEIRHLQRFALDLRKRQEQEDDSEVLPRVTLADIPPTPAIPVGSARTGFPLPLTHFDRPTNRLVYHQVILDVPEMTDELLDLLPLFSSSLAEVGVGARDYLETQAWQSAISGGIGARTSVRGDVLETGNFRCVFSVYGKALTRNQAHLAELIHDTLLAARFDERTRIRELIAQFRAGAEMRVNDNGHVLAMSAASAASSPTGTLHERWSGMSAIRRLKQLDESLDDPVQLDGLCSRFKAIQEILLKGPRQLLVVGEQEDFPGMEDTLRRMWADGGPGDGMDPLRPRPVRVMTHQGWEIVTTVNFCARVNRSVPFSHPDAPVLSVLGQYLKNGFLHRAIRERGGAYGGGAGYDSDTGSFRFYSYRDPRLSETIADFQRSLEWLHEGQHPPRALEEAILGVIGAIDRPASPAGEARRAFHDTLHGRTPERRGRYRAAVLNVTLEDLRRVGGDYLRPEEASYAVVGSAAALDRETDSTWKRHSLQDEH
ncbi:MAG: insulinase family protein [Magnetococcales bacterium]|nr:insulinase family protein [Magnetococcales bacterium]